MKKNLKNIKKKESKIKINVLKSHGNSWRVYQNQNQNHFEFIIQSHVSCV